MRRILMVAFAVAVAACWAEPKEDSTGEVLLNEGDSVITPGVADSLRRVDTVMPAPVRDTTPMRRDTSR